MDDTIEEYMNMEMHKSIIRTTPDRWNRDCLDKNIEASLNEEEKENIFNHQVLTCATVKNDNYKVNEDIDLLLLLYQ